MRRTVRIRVPTALGPPPPAFRAAPGMVAFLIFAGALAAQGGGRTFAFISPPEPQGCVTEVGAGEHTFSCDGLTYQVVVDEMCLRVACGVIFDIHGAGMSGRTQRDATQLHLLAPGEGYLVVHPSAEPNDQGGAWDLVNDPPKMRSFMDEVVGAFHADADRIHVTGFSMGAAMTFAFLCNYNDVLASVAVVTGVSANQVMAPDGERRCVDSFDANWQPRVPILFMNGVHDPALTPDLAHARVEAIVSGLGLTGGTEIDGREGHYTRRHWTGDGGMAFDFLEHQYSTPGRLGGHCMPRDGIMPGSPNTLETNGVVCSVGDPAFHWGRVALQWFMDHPRNPAP